MTAPIPQATEAELRQMSAEQIFEAFNHGRLNTLIGRPVPPDPTTGGVDNQVTEEELKRMYPTEIVKALGEGRLNTLIGRPVFAGQG